MQVIQTPLQGLLILQPQAFKDERGWFMESFNEQRFFDNLATLGEHRPRRFVQDNQSCSRAGVLRGLHFQRAPHAQGKLVRVVHGAAFDVAVDIRPGSASFGRWFGIELNADNKRQLWIPEGYAHGFLALQDDTQFLYKTTDVYQQGSEGALRWDDPDIAIDWPLPAGLQAPRVNAKDAAAPHLADLPERR